MAVAITTNPNFTAGAPKALFEDGSLVSADHPDYDVSDDGRFVMIETLEGQGERKPSIRIVLNWFAEFKDREQD